MAPLLTCLLAGTLAAACADAPTDPGPAIPVPQVRDAAIPWQAEPIRLPDDQLAAALRACQVNQMIPPGAQIVLVDARGRGRVIALFTAPGATSGDCVVERDTAGFSPRSGSAQTGGLPRALGPNEIDANGANTEGGAAMNGLTAPATTSMTGRIGANVAAVQLVVAGKPILASTGNGWFAAWWPSDDPVTRTIVLGANGLPLTPGG